jgi:hypothetical protein
MNKILPSPFFWLHIKKAAGMTTRSLLQPHYTQVQRTDLPGCYKMHDPVEWNDVLNNYRIPLGHYQFRRCLFAKEYLYSEKAWNNTLKFAFSREPISRCKIMFFYLFWNRKLGTLRHRAKQSLKQRRNLFNIRYAFDSFLDTLEARHDSESIYHPVGLEFQTHTAPMCQDVSDKKGVVMLDRIYRLDCLYPAVEEVLGECGLSMQQKPLKKNVSQREELTLTSQQKTKISQLYANDFEIYENALVVS